MRERGFTYIGALLAIALLSAGLAAAGALWSVASKRDREAELLFVGGQFRQAIMDFHDVVPAGQQSRFPRNFDELLLDKRWPVTRRHLRKVFLDPMTGAADWVLVPAPGSGISGVHSRSLDKPLKHSGFSEDDRDLENAPNYTLWVFGYPSGAAVGAAAASQPPGFKLPSLGTLTPLVHP